MRIVVFSYLLYSPLNWNLSFIPHIYKCFPSYDNVPKGKHNEGKPYPEMTGPHPRVRPIDYDYEQQACDKKEKKHQRDPQGYAAFLADAVSKKGFVPRPMLIDMKNGENSHQHTRNGVCRSPLLPHLMGCIESCKIESYPRYGCRYECRNQQQFGYELTAVMAPC